ncbi:MAG: hypothetical protein WDM90_18990 [Ferruginibacter sp.]
MASTTHTFLTDTDIQHWLVHNEIAGWEMLYDKYASMMHGIFFRVYKDSAIAETVFTACFLELTGKKETIIAQANLCSFLVKYAGAYMRQNVNEKYSIMNVAEGFALNVMVRSTC